MRTGVAGCRRWTWTAGNDSVGQRQTLDGREKENPGGRDPGALTSICTLVAGVGFEPTTFGL